MAEADVTVPSFFTHRNVALLLTGLGACGLVTAIVQRPTSYYHMSTGMDGVLTCGILGFLLVVLDGHSFRRVLDIMAPIVVIQLAASVSQSLSLFWFFGLEALVYGCVGLVMTAPPHQRAKGRRRAGRPRRKERKSNRGRPSPPEHRPPTKSPAAA